MDYKQALQYGKNELKDLETTELDTSILLQHVLNIDKIKLLTNNNVLTKTEQALYEELIETRKKGKPIAYILNEKEFFGLPFYVDENCLIPRPDTEILVEECINIINEHNLKSFLEIGIGSGCISISLSKNTNIYGDGVDIFAKNIEISKNNAILNNVANLHFYLSDLFENVDKKYDLLVSNPPYIDIEDKVELTNQILDFEPHSALFADNNGLMFYEKIIEDAHNYLNEGGFLAFEIGYNQRESVIALMEQNNYKNIKCYKDYGTNDRVVIGQKGE